MITIEKLKIYRLYEGDGDGFARSGRPSYQRLFDEGDWGIIEQGEQNIELIAKGLTSPEFRNRTIDELRNKFDSDAFVEITKPISAIIFKVKENK